MWTVFKTLRGLLKLLIGVEKPGGFAKLLSGSNSLLNKDLKGFLTIIGSLLLLLLFIYINLLRRGVNI
jgi:hypothetical protein